jgi:alpha-glucosidase
MTIMKMKKIFLVFVVCMVTTLTIAAKGSYQLTSPDGKLSVNITTTNGVNYAVSYAGQELLAPSPVSMTFNNGKEMTAGKKVKSVKASSHNGIIKPLLYKKNEIQDNYNQLVLTLENNFSLIFRAYNEGMAYRFVAAQKKDFIVEKEQASFNFAKDWQTYIPYVTTNGTVEQQFSNSFENPYTHTSLSKVNPEKISFLPFMVEAENNVKMVITEADLENYPGLYVQHEEGQNLKGVLAGYPKEIQQGGHNELELLVKSHENFLAKAKAQQAFPWRIISVSTEDKNIQNNDMVYRLAAPSRVADTKWVKPGKVAWDWWNDWGVYNVPFKAGINTQTYKYYIDFASKHGIEYVILDEGWAVNKKADLFQIVPEINLQEIVDYAKSKNVGIILWAGYYAFDRDMEHVCKHYSEMGVKGFKVDFINRDDQLAVDFLYRSAAMAAKYHLMLDFHGIYKPTGLNRTYPNVINFEGVAGLEQNKWSSMERYNQVNFDVLLPFGRLVAGQMDYTQGAMLNGTQSSYRSSNTEPMSQGTRCHQLAEYAVFFSPLNMLCDSPTHYEQNPECTDFIAKFPVVWDETIPLDSKMGEYVAVARRSGSEWYVGVINNWTARNLTLNLSELKIGGREVRIVRDGPNAEKIAADHLHETMTIPANGEINIHLAPGGGFALTTAK